MITVHLTDSGIILPLKVTPKGGQDKVLPFSSEDEWVKIKVTAPPESGKANQAVLQLLSKTLGIPKKSLSLVSGETSRLKRVAIQTTEPQTLLLTLATLMHTTPEESFSYFSCFK